MYIVQIASEIAPVAKVGGLADVMMGLSRELIIQGHDVDIFIPKYDCLVTNKLSFEEGAEQFDSFFKGQMRKNLLFKARFNGDFLLSLIEPQEMPFFNRGQIYGFPDDVDRFLYFSRACLDFLVKQQKIPDVIHIHDWQLAALSFLIQNSEFQEHFKKTKVVFTIHNLEYQGRCRHFNLDDVGYQGSKEQFLHPEGEKEGADEDNLMKAAIISSHRITTVSPTYAKEVLTPEKSHGLYETLYANREKFSGVLNGLDYTYWNPVTDQYLEANFSYADAKLKLKNKWALVDELGLCRSIEKPLVAAITRLVPQKGVHLLKHLILQVEALGYQMVLLGTAPDPRVHAEFQELESRYKDHKDVRIVLKNEEPLAHRVYAAADLFCVPSLFEPCGLTQMIALRYGAIPIVRHTGGLADTVFDVEQSQRPFAQTNGFVFEEPQEEALSGVLKRALSFYRDDKEKWHALVLQGMKQDFSWKKPAESYLKIYSN
jgi:starch synthase